MPSALYLAGSLFIPPHQVSLSSRATFAVSASLKAAVHWVRVSALSVESSPFAEINMGCYGVAR